MSFQSGTYIFSSLTSGRSLGQNPTSTDSNVVVLPAGVVPPLWEVIKVKSGNYNLFQHGKQARVNDKGVYLTPARIVPLEWSILRVAPPHGERPNHYIISLVGEQSQQSWSIAYPGASAQDKEIPVTVATSATLIGIELVSPKASEFDTQAEGN